MMALAHYLTQEEDAASTIDRLIRILDCDSLRDAITEVLVEHACIQGQWATSRSDRHDRLDL